MRCSSLGTLALCLLLTACGLDAPPESVPISGVGGSGGGAGSGGSASGGGAVNGVPILSHNAGTDCMSCHKAGGTGRGIFTVAGTVYMGSGGPQVSATVSIYPQGSTTAQATLTTDGLGNFFTTQTVAALVPAAGQQFVQGVNVVIRPTGGSSRAMLGVVSNGSCNSCHSQAGGVARVTAKLRDASMDDATAPVLSSGDLLPAVTTDSSTSLAQIATGAAHSCVVKSDGGVRCWGANDLGQLGSAASGSQAAAVSVTALGHVSASAEDHAIAAGDNHTCVIAATGGLVLCWGANDHAQLGNGSNAPAAAASTGLHGVTALNAAGDATCARVGEGAQASFYCWGDGSAVRRVDPDADNQPAALPALVTSSLPGITTADVAGLEAVSFTHVASNAGHSCGITTDNRVKCWEGTYASVDVPVM
jgi:hypothetical protein